jgi:hypothetical protein
MSSIFTPRPAYPDLGGFVALLSIAKRFPAFLQCEGRFFPSPDALGQAQVMSGPQEFRDAVATLPVNAVFSPLTGGLSLSLYVSKPGFEEDFKEVASDIAVDGLDLVRTAPDDASPSFLIFAKREALQSAAPPPEDAKLAEAAQPEQKLERPAAEQPAPVREVVSSPEGAPVPEPLAPMPAAPEKATVPEVKPALAEPAEQVPLGVAEPERMEENAMEEPANIRQPAASAAAARASGAVPTLGTSVAAVAATGGRRLEIPAILPVTELPSGEGRAELNRQLLCARQVAAGGQVDELATALQIYDRAACDYRPLWRNTDEAERQGVIERLARGKVLEARRALATSNWDTAAAALAHAVLCPATTGEALSLQSALLAYLRGQLEQQQGNLAAAAASFSFAADHSAELRERATQQAQAAARQGSDQGQASLHPALKQLFAEQQSAASAALEERLNQLLDQVSARQLAAARQAQDEQAQRQQAAQRQLQQEQAAQLQGLLVKLQNEQSEWQQETFQGLERDQQARMQALAERPAWFAAAMKEQGRAVNEQVEQSQASLKGLQEQMLALQKAVNDLRRDATTAPSATGGSADLGGAVKELAWKAETQGRAVRSLSGRVTLLLGLNVLLWLVVAAGFVLSAVYNQAALTALRSPTAVFAAGTKLTATAPAVVTAEPTVPLTGVALNCADSNIGRVFYDCTLANGVAYPQALSLSVAADGGQLNGFFPSVTLAEKELLPDVTTSLVPLGRFEAGQLKHFRLNLPCAAGRGCPPTNFVIRVINDQATVVPGNELLITSASPAP